MKRQYAVGLVFLLVCVARSEAYVTPRHVGLASMDKNTRELFQESMDLDAQLYDEGVKLVHRPGYRSSATGTGSYMVRESSWYALGLLLRDAAGDRQRAAEILDAVLKQQYLTPGVKWYGTYRRTPEEPDPTGNPVMWRGYDPNWRHFIGTTLAMVLIEFPDRITPELSKRMYEAIDRAIDGEMKEGRLVPSYSNIALMYGFLWDFAGVHDKRDDWRKQAAVWTESVYALFKKYDAFFEYNSPTYYGVDLYGMDQESYVSIVGVWMRTVLDAKTAPLPAIASSTDHVADVWFAPHLAILGTRIPQDAISQIKQFEGEHLLHKQITEERFATAWIGRDVIFGGESTNKTRDVGTASQFHSATVQWRTPSGEIGWVQLTQAPMIDAAADEHGLKISATGTVRFRIHAKDIVQTKVGEKEWELP